MGKLITFISILIFVDILFIATGQICNAEDCTTSSILLNAILNFGEMPYTRLFTELIGDFIEKLNSGTGILSLATLGGGVIIGTYIATKDRKILMIPMVWTLAVLAGDFITIGGVLYETNAVLAMFIMAPITIIYIFTIVDWWNDRD